MTGHRWFRILFIAIIFTAGCATLHPDYEPPSVTVRSFRTIPTEGGAPRFEIGLHIINPNANDLNLRGIAYTVSLEGHKILTGVANELPVIQGYGTGDVTLDAAVDLINSITLIADLVQQPRESFAYKFNAKLDIGAFLPKIHATREGMISLRHTE